MVEGNHEQVAVDIPLDLGEAPVAAILRDVLDHLPEHKKYWLKRQDYCGDTIRMLLKHRVRSFLFSVYQVPTYKKNYSTYLSSLLRSCARSSSIANRRSPITRALIAYSRARKVRSPALVLMLRVLTDSRLSK